MYQKPCLNSSIQGTIMNKKSIFIILWFAIIGASNHVDEICTQSSNKDTANFIWTIIGAGPAGIAVIGILLDLGFNGSQIAWIDPEFNAGRIGKYYCNVPGNAKISDYVYFLNQCKTFNEFPSTSRDDLYACNGKQECPLLKIINPLLDITHHLRKLVISVQDRVSSLEFKDKNWHISFAKSTPFTSHSVVLATGSHPVSLNYPCKKEIQLDIALDKEKLKTCVNSNDAIAVVGSSHSAILILKHLSEIKIARMINLFKNPIRYGTDMGESNQIFYNGLRGPTAHWAYHVLEKNTPTNIFRVHNTQQARDAWLPICNKIIYAIGYQQNKVPLVGKTEDTLKYDKESGIIKPRLFGIGIAFPDMIIVDGKPEEQIGLVYFMKRAQKLIPEWSQKRSDQHLKQFDQLLVVNTLTKDSKI